MRCYGELLGDRMVSVEAVTILQYQPNGGAVNEAEESAKTLLDMGVEPKRLS